MEWLELFSPFITAVMQALGTVVIALGAWGARWLGRKFKIDYEEKYEAQVRLYARRGIRGAEEWALKQMKLDGDKPASAAKLQKAMDFVMSKWPDMIPDELERLIEQELAYMDQMGASGGSVGVRPEDHRG